VRNVVMVIAFQLGWFACVLCGARNWLWMALGAAAAVLACNLWFARQELLRELRLIAFVTGVGFVVESVNLVSGVFTLAVPTAHPWLCPLWLLLLWTLFATLLRGPFRWLAGRYWLGALLGALFAAPNYFAGARLGAVTLHGNTLFCVAVLGAVWALAMPLMIWLARK
jgi:hypothetical protein